MELGQDRNINGQKKHKKILVEKGSKQVGRISSGERGLTVTLCSCVNALRQALPPAFIFPRVPVKII